MTRDEWWRAVLKRLNVGHRRSNLYAGISWIQAEGGTARWNPLNCTREMPGATNYNSVGVKNYVSFEQGLDATTLTLMDRGHRYGPIRKHLAMGDPAPATLKAVEESDWGTTGLALEVLPQVRADYDRWAQIPIAE